MKSKKLLFLTLAIIGFGATVQAQQPLILGIYNLKAEVGETVCAQVYGRDFQEILSMQYTLQWDANALKFKEVKNLGLTGLNENNFGKNNIQSGKLTFMWYDPQLQGISLADGAVNYEVCFEVIGTAGTSTAVQFTSNPTPVEVSMGKGILISLNTEGGKIEIK